MFSVVIMISQNKHNTLFDLKSAHTFIFVHLLMLHVLVNNFSVRSGHFSCLPGLNQYYKAEDKVSLFNTVHPMSLKRASLRSQI